MPDLIINGNTSNEAFKAFAQKVDADHHVLATEIRDPDGNLEGYKLYTDKRQNLAGHDPAQLQKKYRDARKAVNLMLGRSGRNQRLPVNQRMVGGHHLKNAVSEDFGVRYEEQATRQKIRDEMIRDHSPRQIREKLDEVSDHHGTRVFSRRRRFWDWKLGAEAKGRSSLGPRGMRVGTRLQQVRAHRDRRELVHELGELERASRRGMSQAQRDRRNQLVGELSLVLSAQRQQLSKLAASRSLSPDEKAWSERLESAVRMMAKLDSALEKDPTAQISSRQFLTLSSLIETEPASVSRLSDDRSLERAAEVHDPALARSYRQAALGDILRTASDHSIGVDGREPKDYRQRTELLDKYRADPRLADDDTRSVETLRAKHTALQAELTTLDGHIREVQADLAKAASDDDRDTDTHLLETLRRSRARLDPLVRSLGDDFARLDATEVSNAYSKVLKSAEQKGLLGELEQKGLAAPATGTALDYRRADGTTLRVTTDQVGAALRDWGGEHETTAREASRSRWSRFKGWVASKFHWLSHFKTSTKGVDAGLEAKMTVDERAGAGGDLDERLEAAARGIDITEHVAGMAVAVKGVLDKQRAIGAKKAKKAMGAELEHEYQQNVRNAPAADRTALGIRSAVVEQYGRKLQDQTVSVDRSEQVMLGGHALRHGVQTGASIVKVSGKAVAVGAGMAIAGGIGGVVFETGEALIAGYETGKAAFSSKQLSDIAAQQSTQITEKYRRYLPDGAKPTVKAVQERLGTLKEELRTLDKQLADLGDGDDEFDHELRQTIERNKQRTAALVEDMATDLQKLNVTSSLIGLLKDRKNVGMKALVTGQKTAAAAGYGLALAVTIGVGGLTVALAPVGAGIATATAIGLIAYQSGKDSHQRWRSDRSADALVGRADPKIVQELRKEAADKGISPEQVALNRIARRDPRYMAAQHLYQLKRETRLVRWSDRELRTLNPGNLAQRRAEHEAAIFEVSETARHLRDALKMPTSAIAALVDASNDDEHDEIGRKLIEEHLEEE